MPTAVQPIELPDWAWERAEVRQALRARNMGAVFRHVQQYALDDIRAVLADLGIGPEDLTRELYTDAVAAQRR